MTVLGITHTKVSAIPDCGDASLVEPSDWNAAHTLSGIASSDVTLNSFVGVGSGNVTLTGTGNTGIGVANLLSLTTGSGNVGLGVSALAANQTGDSNMAVGAGAMFSSLSCTQCVAIGGNANFTATASPNNVAIGFQALYHEDSTVGYNTCVGWYAGFNISTGYGNIVIGADADTTNGPTSGLFNTLIGTTANLASATANSQLCIMNMIYGTALDGAGNTISSGAIGIGVKAPGEKLDVAGNIKSASVRGTAVLFANVPGTPVEGMLVAITDSTTAVWGATITGTGANHVLGYYNGTNWTVAGK